MRTSNHFSARGDQLATHEDAMSVSSVAESIKPIEDQLMRLRRWLAVRREQHSVARTLDEVAKLSAHLQADIGLKVTAPKLDGNRLCVPGVLWGAGR
jgi:uncharacterized protein YjiS (DUF1127 family)